MNKKATINDVAKLAGVSITTVSRTINDNYPVKKETKEKIFKAIEILNFTPNELAVSMITKKTKTIGVVIPSISNAFFSTLVKGINEVVEKNNYTLLVCTSNNNEKEIVVKLVSRQVDGIIIADGNLDSKKDFYNMIQKTIPLIFINSYDENFNYVSCDQKKGAYDALNFLKEKGHQNVLFIRGNENSESYNLKEKIFCEVFEKNEILVVDSGNKDNAILNTKNDIVNFYEKNRNITGIFACNDLMAVGVIKGLNHLKINIPNEVEVIGFDNTFLCELVAPTLSTVSQHITTLGKISCEKILQLIEKNDKINVLINCDLVLRESCRLK
ncbi:MAG: LacI family DNA-binding transcriptional regulator [Lachnospirales bacterium]